MRWAKKAVIRFDLLTGAYILFWMAVGVLVFALVMGQLSEPEFKPLNGYTEAEILNLDTVQRDGYVRTARERCNEHATALAVITFVSFHKDNAHLVAFSGATHADVVTRGCGVVYEQFSLPVNLTEGEWRLVGYDSVEHGTQRQSVVWESEPFVVREE